MMHENKKIFSSALSFVAFFLLGMMLHTNAFADTSSPTSDATVAFEGGAITLVQAPSFNFGIIPIGVDTCTATGDKTLKVTDFRGTFDGWCVSVALTQNFQDTSALNAPDLVGVNLALINGSVSTSPTGVDVSNPTVTSTASVAVNATANKGMNTNEISYQAQLSGLRNSGERSGASYQAQLTWTISNTPQ